MRTFGTVTDYKTGEPIRPATAREWRQTADVFNSGAPGSSSGAWEDRGGRSVYVDGGPDAEVTADDITALRQEAATAGDDPQVRLCVAALAAWHGDLKEEGDDAAFAECVRVILDTRMNAAEDEDQQR